MTNCNSKLVNSDNCNGMNPIKPEKIFLPQHTPFLLAVLRRPRSLTRHHRKQPDHRGTHEMRQFCRTGAAERRGGAGQGID